MPSCEASDGGDAELPRSTQAERVGTDEVVASEPAEEPLCLRLASIPTRRELAPGVRAAPGLRPPETTLGCNVFLLRLPLPRSGAAGLLRES
eukprot:3339946-Rhodomonas_salina.7